MNFKCKKCGNVYNEYHKLCGFCAGTEYEMTDEVEPLPCPSCGGLRGGHANRRCPLMTLEYAQQEIINVEQRWIKINSTTSSNWQKYTHRLKTKISTHQGKMAILKHENNKLRKALHEKYK